MIEIFIPANYNPDAHSRIRKALSRLGKDTLELSSAASISRHRSALSSLRYPSFY